jgi:hypothetical protein
MSARKLSVVLLGVVFVLTGVIVVLDRRLQEATGGATSYITRTALVTNTVRQIAVRKINATNLLAALSRPANWAALESTNYVVYIENLRAFDCPEETIKDIILTDVARLYAKRRTELRRQLQPQQYWRPEFSNPGANTRLQQELYALDREQRALVHQLLGVDFQTEFAKYTGEEDPGANYDFLSSERREQLLAIQSKFSELEEQIYARSQGLMLDEDEEQLNQLQKQREAELARLLSPQELEEYELRRSNLADNLRNQITGFSPNEDEFRQLFRLHKQYDDQINRAFNVTDDAQWETRARAQEEAQQALEQETRKVLGTDRYAELQRAQDADYRALVQITDRYQLPQDVAQQIYDMKRVAEQQKVALENNPSLSDDQRLAGLVAISQTTEKAVAQAFKDPKIYRSYRKAAGQWLQGLSEPLQPPMPPVEQ